jgi:hypothetical protein
MTSNKIRSPVNEAGPLNQVTLLPCKNSAFVSPQKKKHQIERRRDISGERRTKSFYRIVYIDRAFM